MTEDPADLRALATAEVDPRPIVLFPDNLRGKFCICGNAGKRTEFLHTAASETDIPAIGTLQIPYNTLGAGPDVHQLTGTVLQQQFSPVGQHGGGTKPGWIR